MHLSKENLCDKHVGNLLVSLLVRCISITPLPSPRSFYFECDFLSAFSSDVISSEKQENIGPESSAPPESAPTSSEQEVPPAPQAFNGLSAYQRARAAMFMSDDR